MYIENDCVDLMIFQTADPHTQNSSNKSSIKS